MKEEKGKENKMEIEIRSPHLPPESCRWGHDYQFIKEWYEDLDLQSTSIWKRHKVMLICRKCGQIIIQDSGQYKSNDIEKWFVY